DLVEEAAVLVIGPGRDPELDREPQLLGRSLHRPHRLRALLGVSLHRPAGDVEQQVADVGVVVEDRAGSDASLLGDVLDPQADGPFSKEPRSCRTSELIPPRTLVLPPHSQKRIRSRGWNPD